MAYCRFAAADLDSLALIGPGALQTFAHVTGDEQSFGRAERQVGVWHALKEMAPRAKLKLAIADDMTGVPIPASALKEMRSDSGATAPIYDADIDFTRRAGRALPAGSRRSWTGTLIVPVAGDYDIDLQLLGATGQFGIDGRSSAEWPGGADTAISCLPTATTSCPPPTVSTTCAGSCTSTPARTRSRSRSTPTAAAMKSRLVWRGSRRK